MKCDFLQTRILSVFNLLKQVGFAFLCLGITPSAFAQPYEPVRLYDMIGDTNQRIGESIFESLGDQDGDGYTDFLVNVGINEGFLRIIYGGEEPPYRTLDFAHIDVDTTTTHYYWICTQGNSGQSVSADYTDDGVIDILLDLRNESAGRTPYFYLFVGGGGPDEFDTLWDWRYASNPSSVVLTGLGDFNANGTPDFTRGWIGGGSGTSLWYFDWSWPDPPTEPTWAINRPGPNNNANFRSSQGVGDITGDGWPDFIHDLRYPDGSLRYEIWYGGPEADSIPDYQFIQDTLSVDIDVYGILGDVNGDGIDDIGAYVFDSHAPRGPAIFYGGLPLNILEPDVMLEHNSGEAVWLDRAQTVGDINDDGYEDIGVVDINRYSCYLYLGGNPMDSLWSFYLPAADFEEFRTSLVRGIGDFNGDGIDDWAISADEDFWTTPRRGRVVVFAGDRNWGVPVTNERPSIPNEFLLSVFPNPFNSTLSISLDVPLHQDVTLSLYDLLGREVGVIYRGRLSSSTISYVAPSSLSSGVYFLRAVSGARSELVKVALVK